MEKANYILELQEQGKSRHEIKDILGYKLLDSMTKYMRKRGFKVINDKYVKGDDSCHHVENSSVYVVDDTTVPSSFNNNNFKNDMLEIVEHKDTILDMITWFKNSDDKGMTNVIEVINTGIKIDLPDSENIRTTIRINKEVWDEFNLFCEDHNEFSKQDLLAQAIKNFVSENK